MTKEEKVEAFSMRLDGLTLQEIADKFGVSRQYIQQSVLPAGQCRSMKQTKYPALDEWMKDNHSSIHNLAEKSGVTSNSLYRSLCKDGDASKSTIDKILKVTGLAYEKAFALPDGEKSANETAS